MCCGCIVTVTWPRLRGLVYPKTLLIGGGWPSTVHTHALNLYPPTALAYCVGKLGNPKLDANSRILAFMPAVLLLCASLSACVTASDSFCVCRGSSAWGVVWVASVQHVLGVSSQHSHHKLMQTFIHVDGRVDDTQGMLVIPLDPAPWPLR